MNRILSIAALPLLLAACNESMEEVSTSGSNAFAAYEDGRGSRVESFYFGGQASNAVVDYVFVLDNSISMRQVLERVRKGFESLEADRWPRDARIAVLSTLPHDLDDPEKLHRTVRSKTPEAIDDPGFTQFVSRDSIAWQKEHADARTRKRFEAAGCDEWFAPGDVSADGTKCIVAHTQIALGTVVAEAGLTAVKQLLDRNRGEAIFRPGAAVNIVFVSDTHDPGVGGKAARDLLKARPTAEQLVQMIERDNSVSSVRFHAIAPETECVEKWKAFGPAYFEAAEATGGQRLDMCQAEDYRPILNAVIEHGSQPTRPVFALGTPAQTVHEVTVDGEPTKWTLDGAGSVVVDVVPQPGAERVIEVHFDKAPVTVTPKARKRTARKH